MISHFVTLLTVVAMVTSSGEFTSSQRNSVCMYCTMWKCGISREWRLTFALLKNCINIFFLSQWNRKTFIFHIRCEYEEIITSCYFTNSMALILRNEMCASVLLHANAFNRCLINDHEDFAINTTLRYRLLRCDVCILLYGNSCSMVP